MKYTHRQHGMSVGLRIRERFIDDGIKVTRDARFSESCEGILSWVIHGEEQIRY